MTDVPPQRAGIGGAVMFPAAPLSQRAGLYAAASDNAFRNPRVYVYSLEAYEGTDPDAELLCTWDFTGIGGLNAVQRPRALPDGRVLVSGFTASPLNKGVLIEVPANAPLVDGTPPCRVAWEPDAAANANLGAVAQTQFGELLLGLNPSGATNRAIKLAPELVGWPATVNANAIVYTEAATNILDMFDSVCDLTSGLQWGTGYAKGCHLWDFTGPAGVIAPSVSLTGSNWNSVAGCAVSSTGEFVGASYDLNRLQILAGPFATGNPAPTRTLGTTSALDRGLNSCIFDARTGDVVCFYYDTGTIAVFSAAQYAAGGTVAPIRRFNLGVPGLVYGELAAGIGVRR